MNATTNIIRINESFVKYEVKSNEYIFSVLLSDLLTNNIEHDASYEEARLHFNLLNNLTNNVVKVYLDMDQSRMNMRVYQNKDNPDRIIKLVVT